MTACVLGAIECLLEVLGREHAEDHRNTGGETDFLQAARTFTGDEVVVARIATDDTAEADDGIELTALETERRRQRLVTVGARWVGTDTGEITKHQDTTERN